MSIPTLNEMITAAINSAEDDELGVTSSAEVQKEKVASVSTAGGDVVEESEKLASVLEFIGNRGVRSMLEKSAEYAPGHKVCKECGKKDCKCPAAKSKGKDKKAAADSGGSLPTNEGQMHRETKKKQVGPHAGAPSMKSPGDGQIPNNEDKKPGSGKSVDTSGKQTGTHHPSLASNEAAINYDKKEKAKKVAPSLKAVLDTSPFADPKLKETLKNSKTDKNIHAKTAHDASAVRAELSRRMLLKQGVADA